MKLYLKTQATTRFITLPLLVALSSTSIYGSANLRNASIYGSNNADYWLQFNEITVTR